jgi:F-type H+-transporting ATPase subunit a
VNFEPHVPHMLLDFRDWFGEDTWLQVFNIDNVVLAEWIVLALALVVGLMFKSRVAKVPRGRLQHMAEILVDFLEDWFAGYFPEGRKDVRKYFWLLGGLFLFILLGNYMGLIPFAGYHWFFFPYNSQWGVTAMLAIVVFFVVQYVTFKELGFGGGAKHWLHLFPLGMMEQFIKPLSLSVRLFGNIFAEELLLAIALAFVPSLVPLPFMLLDILFGAIQAIVFATLTAVYIGEILEAKHAHGH